MKIIFLICLHSNKFDVHRLYKQGRSFVEDTMKCTNTGILNKYLTQLIFTLSSFMYANHNFYL